MNIWSFQEELTRRLGWWAGISIISGGLLNLLRDPFWKGVGVQFVGWGLVNATIAFFGKLFTHRRFARLPDSMETQARAKEAANLEKILWINTGLDVFYITGGLFLVAGRGRKNRQLAGFGWGIAIQGAFLFLFDLIHAAALRQRNISH